MRARAIVQGGAALGLFLAAANPTGAILPEKEGYRDAKRFSRNRLNNKTKNISAARTVIADFNRKKGAISAAGLSVAPAAGDSSAKRQADEFLKKTRNLGIDGEVLSALKQSHGNGHRHVLYQQSYRGLPVEFSRVKVHMDNSGNIIGVDSGFQSGLRTNIVPSLDSARAAETVRQDVGRLPSSQASLVILPDGEGGANLAWKFTLHESKALWRYYVDAHDGRLLFRYNDMRMVCAGASGTVSGMVFDVDPVKDGRPAQAPASRPFNHQNVYIRDGVNFAQTQSDGSYCHASLNGKISTQLQGPFVNVGNFLGLGLQFENGGAVWATAGSPVSSPHPYPNSSVLISTIDLSAVPGVVKALPVFTSFNVGAVDVGSFNESADITDDDEVAILDSAGHPVASYVGNRGAFSGAAVPGSLIRLRLKSNALGQNTGYDVAVSSYMTFPDPVTPGVTGDVLWVATQAAGNLRSEISLFYHLNRMHDYFADLDRSSAAFIAAPVNAMALAGPNIANAFYDPDYDNLFFGDAGATPSDLFADDATVSHHEYTHYVMQKIWPMQNFGQAGAISEATADYFSASSLNSSSIAPYTNQGFNGGVYAPLRELDCPTNTACRVLSATNWGGEIHDDSLFLSQALWDIRRARVAAQGLAGGQACADGLVFQAMLFFPESFSEFLSAMEYLNAAGAVPACGGVVGITPFFSAHGLPAGAGVNDAYDTAASHNDGFESAADISDLGSVNATIYPAGDMDFYTFGAGPGAILLTLTPPQDGFFFKGYSLTLYDLNHNPIASAPATFDGPNGNTLELCGTTDCTTTREKVILNYFNDNPGHFYISVSGGPTADGGSNSGVNSTVPYSLSVNYVKAGAVGASVVSASFDNDKIDFSVHVTTYTKLQDYRFAYAQLRDQALAVLPNTRTHEPALSNDYLTVVSSVSALGSVSGMLSLVSGFNSRFPAAGTISVEIFATDAASNTISMGLSRPLNLSTNRSELAAWNNIFNPLKGEKATVKYDIQNPGRVTIRLYTLSGTFIATLLDGDLPAGKGSVDWRGRNFNGSAVASGIYLVHMDAPGFSKTQKIAVIK